MSLRLALAAMMLTALPLMAAAQAAPCAPATNDQERLDCDVAHSAGIASKGEGLFGAAPEAWLRIIDTQSASGAAYVYYVIEEGPYQMLEARSVPGAAATKAPACKLRTALPMDVAAGVKEAAAGIAAAPPAGYGPREAVVLNPDGSRSIRLIVDSHDIITRINAGDRTLNFSRLAGAEDAITQLNNLVIGVANFSGDWSCDAV
ncbi:MAG: hypothetical protein C0456_12080 [Hyphomonas sp.]|uniref:hypothetical protein n=1 Tax=Hyphomonas sp. TaxID=87 RepID=UPI001DE82198|nr:hypothetical protein [Hyphomonas sp.]MBA4227360.1 hypothetical protein [Hyphomonas sp.]